MKMKYQFNKIFLLLVKSEKNAGKPYFGPDLGLLGPTLGRDSFGRSFQLCYMLGIVPSCNPVQYQGKLIMQS